MFIENPRFFIFIAPAHIFFINNFTRRHITSNYFDLAYKSFSKGLGFVTFDKLKRFQRFWKKLIFNAVIRSQFSYCPMVWMFYSRQTMLWINCMKELLFPVSSKRWKISIQQLLSQELVPYFGFPSYQPWSAIVTFLFKS